jgi:hypothetical protein
MTATNGNEPTTQGTNQKLAAALRDMQAGQPTAAAKEELYDLISRGRDTSRAIRDMANYSNQVADDFDRFLDGYVGHMRRLLGKVGK